MSRRAAVFAAVLAIVAVAVLATTQPVGATSMTTTDPSGDSAGGTGTPIDLTSVSHSDDSVNLSYAAHTAQTFSNTSDFYQMEWELDLNSNGIFHETPDACIEVVQNGSGGLQAELHKGCSTTSDLTAAVMTAKPGSGGEDLSFSFSLTQFRTATSFTGTSYQYRMNSLDIRGNADRVPNSGVITHTLGSSSTPTPTATPTTSPTSTPTATPTPKPTSTPASTPTPTPGPNDTTQTIQLSNSTVTPGQSVDLSGGGFKATAELAITFQSTPIAIGTAQTNVQGVFSASVKVPSNATAGSHHFVVAGANGAGGTNSDIFPVTVRASTTTGGTTSGSPTSGGTTSTGGTSSSGAGGSSASLPRTGANIAVLLVGALVLCYAGIEILGLRDRIVARLQAREGT